MFNDKISFVDNSLLLILNVDMSVYRTVRRIHERFALLFNEYRTFRKVILTKFITRHNNV